MPTTTTLGTTSFSLQLSGGARKNFGDQSFPYDFNARYASNFTHGVGVNQAEAPLVLKDTVSTSLSLVTANVSDIDLTAATGPFGVVSADSLRWLIIANLSTTAGENIIIGGATNPFVGPLGGTNPTYTLGPGEYTIWWNNTSAGWVVNSGAKNLRLRSATGTPAVEIYAGVTASNF